MKILITGTSSGIGKETALKFLSMGHKVIGIDVKKSSIKDKNYIHYVADVSDYKSLPRIRGINILINNAGTQEEKKCIDVNLQGVINCSKKYGFQKEIKSIVNISSASSITGAEFPSYVASKGGVSSYTKYTALQLAKYGATCNSLAFGGVITKFNNHILKNEKLWGKVLNETLLNKWADVKECAEWIYFVSSINKSMTAQEILIDNGEMAKSNFIW